MASVQLPVRVLSKERCSSCVFLEPVPINYSAITGGSKPINKISIDFACKNLEWCASKLYDKKEESGND